MGFDLKRSWGKLEDDVAAIEGLEQQVAGSVKHAEDRRKVEMNEGNGQCEVRHKKRSFQNSAS